MAVSSESSQQQAENWGIDITLLDSNLERTPTERLILHEQSLMIAQQLQKAWDNARTQQHSKTSASK